MSNDNIKKAVTTLTGYLASVLTPQQLLNVTDLLSDEPTEPAIPDGWEVVTEGKTETGDQYYNKGMQGFINLSYGMSDVPLTTFDVVIRPIQQEPVVPSGWEIVENGEDIENGYYFNSPDFGWKQVVDCSCIRKKTPNQSDVIRQTINIDLSKQPEELKWFAMDKNGAWFGFSKNKPEIYLGVEEWWKANAKSYELFESQHPTWQGDWKDSLLQRPETVNGDTQ